MSRAPGSDGLKPQPQQLSTLAIPSSSASTSAQATHLTLSEITLQSFTPSKVFGEGMFEAESSLTSLCFDDRGEYLISAGDDETLHLWSCSNGKHQKKIYSKKYGVHLARFTHNSNSIIYASTKGDNTIRQQALRENTFTQYFRGHESQVTSLEMSPVSQAFLSAATNETIRLWDLRTPTCQGLFPVQGHPIVAFDPEGLVFAIAINELSSILLYNLKIFTEKPFLVIPFHDERYHMQKSIPPRIPVITSLAFSPSGIGLLVGTAGDVHYVVDSHGGHIIYRLRNHVGLENASTETKKAELAMVPEAGVSGQECGWTADGRFVYSGSSDNMVRFWLIPDYKLAPDDSPPQLQSLFPIIELSASPIPGPTRVVRFNPRHAMFASASSQVALWLPNLDEIP